MEPRDPNRIPKTLRLLQEVWEKSPDLRLGQLLVIATNEMDPVPDLFAIEDDTLLRCLGVKNPPPVRPFSGQPVVDLSAVEAYEDIHAAFATAFDFPDYYGGNWDAFYDILTGHDCFPQQFTILGTKRLRENLPVALDQIVEMLTTPDPERGFDPPNVTWK